MKAFLGRLVAICALLLMTTPAFAQGEYRIRTGDTLSIEVLQDSSLNRSALVLPDGRVSFPWAGTVQAAGRTIGQLQETISSSLAPNFVTPPDVFIGVTPAERPAPTVVAPTPEVAPTINVYFLGEVASPGPKELTEGVRLLQALSASGGFTNFAATKRLQLRRTDPTTGMQSVYLINYNALANGAQLRNDFSLADGDVILVPERGLFE